MKQFGTDHLVLQHIRQERMRPQPLSEKRTAGPPLVIPEDYRPPTTPEEFQERIIRGETIFVRAQLNGATLEGLKLGNVNLHGASFKGAVFRDCAFDQTVFSGATFEEANIVSSHFTHCIMLDADFYRARVDSSFFLFSDIQGACFLQTRFESSALVANAFRNAWFARTEFLRTSFTLNDLSDTVHPPPGYCFIDLQSLYLSARSLRALFSKEWQAPEMIRRQREIAESHENIADFLKRCGAPRESFTLYQTLTEAPEYESVFISYSTADGDFARELHRELRKQGVNVWFAPHDMQGGETIVEQVSRAIVEKSRMILILSPNSMQSAWVRTEIRRAIRTEKGVARLFPISITDYDQIRQWELFDPDTGEDLAIHIRGFFIPDFRDWLNPESFSVALSRLAQALKK